MRTANITLGRQTYEVAALPIQSARKWREQFQKPFQAISAALGGLEKIDLSKGSDVAGLLNSLQGIILTAPDAILEMLYAYSPSLADDKERIEREAFDDEVIVALVEVLKLAYPFDSLVRLMPGQKSPPTSTN